MQEKDIIWIDWARFLGIFLVILGHCLQIPKNFLQNFLVEIWHWIYLFHMPLFFIISGYLFKQQERMDWIKLFRGLIIPYFLYQFIFIPIMLLSHLSHGQGLVDTFLKLILGILMGDGYDTQYSYTVCLPAWFIISIIQLRLLFLKIIINNVSTIILSFASIVFLIFQKQLGFDLFCCLDSTIMAIPYFLLGYIMKNKLDLNDDLSNKTQLRYRLVVGGGKIVASIICMIMTIIILGINGPTQMNGPSCGKSVLLNYVAGISGTMIIFLLSSYGSSRSFVKLISRNTLFLIFYHWIMIIFINQVGFRSLLDDVCNPFVQLAIIIVLVALSLLSANYVIKFLQRKYPIILGK